MSTSKKVRFFNEVSTQVTFILFVAFTAILAVVFYIVDTEGYEKIRIESAKLVIQIGDSAVNTLSSDIERVQDRALLLKKNAQSLPLQEDLLQVSLANAFDKRDYRLLGSSGLWPDINALGTETAAHPFLMVHQTDGFESAQTDPSADTSYYQSSWFQRIKAVKPESCMWHHVRTTQSTGTPAMSCGIAIERDNKFWGVSTVNLNLAQIQDRVTKFSKRFSSGYILLLDNSNKVIASSNPERLKYIDDTNGSPLDIKAVVKFDPAWASIIEFLETRRTNAVNQAATNVPATIKKTLHSFDQGPKSTADYSLLNYGAYLNAKDKTGDTTNNFFLKRFDLSNDNYYHGSQAFVFEVPETYWKLILVQPSFEVNAIADGLSKNLINSIMFALFITAGLIYFMLTYLAFNPLKETTDKISQAENLINDKQYNKLNEVTFSNSRNEIGLMNRSITDLLQRIQSNEGKLANINQQLEIKVEERTAELQDTLKELKNSQLQLIRSEKMATLGQMVAGVAHEVNTPLSYVQNNLEIIGQLTAQYEDLIELVQGLKGLKAEQSVPDNEIQQLLADIISASDEIEDDELSDELKELIKDSLFGVEQITEMVLNLRNFARLDESKIKTIDVRECIEASLKIAGNAIKHQEIVTDFTSTPEIQCSPSQINQVLVNLINNASHAIADKPDGRIEVRTRADQQNTYIDVSDNGKGMSPDILKQIFEPFFTTKAAGEGTGLGMAISQQIMEQHNGDISAISTAGMGTTFTLTLPINNELSAQYL